MSALSDIRDKPFESWTAMEKCIVECWEMQGLEWMAEQAAAELAALTQRLEAAEAERDALKEERNKIAKHIRVTLDDGTAPDNLVDHVLFVMIHEYDPMVKRIQRLENELAEARKV